MKGTLSKAIVLVSIGESLAFSSRLGAKPLEPESVRRRQPAGLRMVVYAKYSLT